MTGPNFDVAFSIAGYKIYWYAILLAAGIAVSMLFTDRRSRGKEVPKDIALDLCILGVPFGVLGARLFACVSGQVAWENFFDLTRSGLSFFGGMILAALAIFVYLRLRKVTIGEILDIASPGVFAGIGIGVWGDFFNRTHYGPLVQKAAHKWFPLATYGDDLKIHYAAFFYEFLLCAILIVLYYLLIQKVVQKKANRFLIMTLGYCLGRFCIDCIRQNKVMMGAMAFDQICEIVLAVVCIVLLFPWKRSSASETDVKTQEMGDGEGEKGREAPDMNEQKDSFSGLD